MIGPRRLDDKMFASALDNSMWWRRQFGRQCKLFVSGAGCGWPWN